MHKRKSNYQHFTIFDRPYSLEKMAKGHAVYEAVAEGHCDKCGFLSRCKSDSAFLPPVFAWCSRRKAGILKAQREGGIS